VTDGKKTPSPSAGDGSRSGDSVEAPCSQPPPIALPAQPPSCDPHEWVEENSETPTQTIQKNENLVSGNANKPSQEIAMRGYKFEVKAINANMEKLRIQKTSVSYVCRRCGQSQEVDIQGEYQIAEAMSRSFKGVKSASKQRERLRKIQKQLDSSKNPLAKIDGDLDDADKSKDYYAARNVDTEIVK